MYKTFIFFPLLFLSATLFAQSKLHFKSVVVDTHNDVLSSGVLDGVDISKLVTEGHSDLVRWKQGGLDVQFFSVWTGAKSRTKEGFFHDALQEIDSLNRLIKRNPSTMLFAKNYHDVKKGIRKGKLVSLIGVEGGHMIEESMENLDSLYNLGMRYLTLTWNNSTSWASSAMDETLRPDTLGKKGLNDFGRSIIKRMNELGIMIDLSHAGEQTFYDALATTNKPVLLSHSSVWEICPVFRNVKDDQIRAVAENSGVICINFYSGFISKEYDQLQSRMNGVVKDSVQKLLLAANNNDSVLMRKKWRVYYDSVMAASRPTLAQLVDHIDHIVRLVGDNYVGIGSDYDGVGSVPIGLDDVSTYPKITEELLRRGYSNRSIKKILGGNVLRVMRDNFN